MRMKYTLETTNIIDLQSCPCPCPSTHRFRFRQHHNRKVYEFGTEIATGRACCRLGQYKWSQIIPRSLLIKRTNKRFLLVVVRSVHIFCVKWNNMYPAAIDNAVNGNEAIISNRFLLRVVLAPSKLRYDFSHSFSVPFRDKSHSRTCERETVCICTLRLIRIDFNFSFGCSSGCVWFSIFSSPNGVINTVKSVCPILSICCTSCTT